MRRVQRGRALVSGLVLITLLAAASLHGEPAHADLTFTVNSTGDAGTGGCNATECTLREAIAVANRVSGADTIRFNISNDPDVPGDEARTITPTSELPEITDTLTIDGYSQPGSSANTLDNGTNAVPKVQLDGSSAGPFADGLDVGADDAVVRGLVIGRFGDDGIDVQVGAAGVRLEGNFMGTSATGAQDRGNGDNGVFASRASNLTIGGTEPAARNLISGNDDAGVVLFDGSNGGSVAGNLIGTKRDGTSELGNAGEGLHVLGSSDNTLGGQVTRASNTIAFNSAAGIRVKSLGGSIPLGNSILGNSVFSNGGPGIDLVGGAENPAGVTANDPGDGDSGANGLQNRPVLLSAASSRSSVRGRLNTLPNRVYLIQFYSNRAGSEGTNRVGVDSLTTDANGNATFSSPVGSLRKGHRITATATDLTTGDTSEFSAPRKVVLR